MVRLLVPGSGGFWSASPSVSAQALQPAAARQNVVMQTERQQQAALTYEARVLGALQEVEDSLSALAEERAPGTPVG